MRQKLLLKTMLLLCALIAGGSSAWGQVTIWSEDFSGYSADAVPSGTISMPHTGTTLDASGTLSYSCTNGTKTSGSTNGGITAVKNENLAKGTKPEIMVGKKGSGTGAVGGTFTAVIPLDNISGTLTLTYYQNAYTLSVTSPTEGVSGGQSTKPSEAGQQTTTFTGITTAMKSITIVFQATTTSNVRLDNIVLTGNKVAAGTTAAPTINGNTPFLSNSTVTITNAASADGADIYYTLNGDDPTTTTSATCFAYTAPFTVEATTTVKAIAKHADDENASSVTSKTFTKVTPMTVTAALAAIDALANNGTIADQCVSGIVCTEGSLSSGAITYYISADGTESNRLQVYKGKGLNNASFENASDIAVGDEVVVYGTLKNFNGTTPEFDQGSFLLSKVTKPAPTFSLDITSKTLDAYTKESVDVTLTTNTDGAITCESDDEDVATVALKSGNVYTITAKTEGSATITIHSAASANYKSASAAVAITVEDARTDAGISFDEDAEETTWGESYSTQALTNTNSVAVTWSNTDETVATVNSSTGAITILKAGSTTIKAAFAGNATYKAAVASYTLTVNKAEAGISYSETSFNVELNDDSFVAPTLNNPNALEGITYASDNGTVATVNASTGALSLTTSAEGTVKITATFAGNDNYKSGSANYTINVIDPSRKGTKLNPYTVAEVEEQATATTFGNNIYVTGYIVGSVKNNKCYKTTTANLVNTNLLLADTPDVSFTEGATVASNTDGLIPVELPSSPSSLRTNWGVASNNVIGYKIILKGNAEAYFGTNAIKGTSEISAVSIPAKFNASGYATYASTYPLDFSDDSEYSAWQITGVSGSAITFSQITGTVAAGTGVLLKGTASSSINIPVAASGTDISGTNKLEGITTATAVDNNEYYGLSGNVFKKVNAGTVPAGKALLPASEVSSARELTFVFEDSETTGISDASRLTDDGGMKNDNFFNLKGQRVEKPTKGALYIVNGKKVVIK